MDLKGTLEVLEEAFNAKSFDGNRRIVPIKHTVPMVATNHVMTKGRCSTCDRDLEDGKCFSCFEERDLFQRRHFADPDFSIDVDDIIAGMRQWSPVK